MQVQIPGYKIKRVLGKGGMATVYLAVQEIFEREVALKVMSPSLAEDPSFGQRFVREARIVSQLVHSNIVTVFDVGVHDDLYYFSMEYVAGPDLKQACGQLTLLQKLAVVEDMAQALAFAGAKGYVHRDIKPENVILREASGHAVLMDFGIARAAETDLSVTQTGTSLGTPHYMSPEQAKGQSVDHRSDLYSLGVVLYFLLTERVPYHADSAVAIGIKHITEPVPVLPGYLHLLNPFIAKLMAKQPEQRYQHADDLIVDLKRLDHKKLLKQYALKAKYPPLPDPAAAGSHLTVVHGASTRIERAVSVPEPAYFASRSGLRMWVEQRRWPLAAAASVLAAVIAVGASSLNRQAPATSIDDEQGSVERHVANVQPVDAMPQSAPQQDLPGPQRQGQPIDTLANRIGSGLSSFAHKLNRQQDSLAEQVQQLRREIKGRDGDSGLQQKLNSLARTQFDALGKLLDRGEYDHAQAQFTSVGELFPEHTEELGAIEKRLQRRELLQSHARKAQQRMDQGHYLNPENDSAEYYYFEMLKLSPELPSAHQGLVEMAKRTVAKANKDFLDGDWKSAQSIVERLLAIDPGHRASLELQEKIRDFRQQSGAIEQHLSRARGHLAAGNLYHPKEDSAYAHFQTVLSLQRQNRAALEGLELTHQALEETLFAMVKRGDHRFAQEMLAGVEQVRGDDRRFEQLRREVEGLIKQSQAQPSPTVRRVVVAAESMNNRLTQQESALALDDTLYVGLEYYAFAEQGGRVQAVLYGPQGQAQASVPVLLDQSQGTHFFSVDGSRKGFSEGEYRLKLLLDGRSLAEVAFIAD